MLYTRIYIYIVGCYVGTSWVYLQPTAFSKFSLNISTIVSDYFVICSQKLIKSVMEVQTEQKSVLSMSGKLQYIIDYYSIIIFK